MFLRSSATAVDLKGLVVSQRAPEGLVERDGKQVLPDGLHQQQHRAANPTSGHQHPT
jgi:hypothetical protein